MINKFFKKKSNKKKPYDIKRDKKAEVIRMPKMADSMEYGIVTKWLVEVGDYLEEGELIAEIETEKATMELVTMEHGTILKLVANEGEKIPINGLITIIGNPGEDVSHLLEYKESQKEVNGDETKEIRGFVGEVKMFAGEDIPKNWLKCDGEEFSKEDKKELFAIIGNKYGETEDSFKIPKIDAVEGVDYIICYKEYEINNSIPPKRYSSK